MGIIASFVIGAVGAFALICGYYFGKISTHTEYTKVIRELKDKIRDLELQRDCLKKTCETLDSVATHFYKRTKKPEKEKTNNTIKNGKLPQHYVCGASSWQTMPQEQQKLIAPYFAPHYTVVTGNGNKWIF